MLDTARKILALLTRQERRRGAWVLLMFIIMALLDSTGVLSVMPFLAVLGNPEIVEENPILNYLYHAFGFVSVDRFLWALGLAAFSFVVFGSLFRIFAKYAMHRFTEMRRYSISARLLETYLRQPYAFFLNRHSGDLAKGILSEVDHVVVHVFKPGLNMVAHSAAALAITILLVAVDLGLALAVGLVVGGVYTVVFLGVNRLIGRLGKGRVVANQARFTIASETLGGIKEIKLLGRENAYLSRFKQHSLPYGRYQATNATLAEVPKYLIEAIGFGGILLLALYLMATRGDLGETLPVLGLYTFAGYRLLSAAQQLYSSLIRLRFGLPAIDQVLADLQLREHQPRIRREVVNPLIPRQRIALQNVSFSYPGAHRPALTNIDMEIHVGTTVGIVGSTGAGKTTAVDLLLGLLLPTHGALIVDNIPVTVNNLRNWQAALGYVPQDIFLMDATVAENIALGIAAEAIDQYAVERAAKLAHVHDFIINELPAGYATRVGERGVRLSGGQRQRIGIARALYPDPAVLVFDEATSALDNATEAAVIEAVGTLQGIKTVIIIAHRFSTVEHCDCIYLLKEGKLIAAGGYNKLMEEQLELRRLAGVQA